MVIRSQTTVQRHETRIRNINAVGGADGQGERSSRQRQQSAGRLEVDQAEAGGVVVGEARRAVFTVAARPAYPVPPCVQVGLRTEVQAHFPNGLPGMTASTPLFGWIAYTQPARSITSLRGGLQDLQLAVVKLRPVQIAVDAAVGVQREAACQALHAEIG